MRLMVKMVAVLAGVSVVSTVWFVAVFAAGDGIGALLKSGLLGVLTLVGWAITLVIGPVAAIQLWRFRQSGRRAAIVLFGYGLAYYVVGLLTLRAPDASVWHIVVMAAMFALPLAVLLSPGIRAMFAPFPPRAGDY
jgi:hypothetical protein